MEINQRANFFTEIFSLARLDTLIPPATRHSAPYATGVAPLAIHVVVGNSNIYRL